MNILEVQDLCKTYGTGETEVHALNHVSFSVRKGEFIAIIGESGSGKSTFVDLLPRFYDVNSGKNAQDYFIELYDEDYNLYGAAVCTLPKGTIDWKNICTQMLPAMWRFWGSADDRNLGVYIEILHNYKMSDDQKGETYIIFLTKQVTEDDGSGIIVM